MSPCGCAGKASAPKTWVYTDTKGTQRSFKTEIEARAAQVRSGGTGTITTA